MRDKNLRWSGAVRVALAVLLVSSALPPPASAQTIEWTRQFGSSTNDVAQAISVDASGVYVAGYTEGTLPGQTSAGFGDAFVRKFDVAGTELWTRQFGSPNHDEASGIAVAASGVYVAGWTVRSLPGQTSAGGFSDAFVRKYDVNGNEMWTRQFGTAALDQALAVDADASGVYVAGVTVGTLPGQTSAGFGDAFVRKYDADGNEVWTRQFGSSSSDQAFGVSVGASGVYVTGPTGGALPGQISSGFGGDFVRKYDADGNEVWTRQFGSSNFDVARGISVDASGIFLAGQALAALPGQTSAGELDAFVRKYDADGNEVWTRQFGSPLLDEAPAVDADASGVYVTGVTVGTLPGQASAGGADAFVRKYDADGNEVWTRQFGSSNSDEALGVSVDASGIYVAGRTFGTLLGQSSAGEVDAYVVKFSLVPPQEALRALIAQVVALNLKQGISNSLDAKLEAAVEALDDMKEGNNVAAVNALQAFINSVEAQRGIHISEADADSLIAAAQAILGQLSGP
jgi:hypothetical protein